MTSIKAFWLNGGLVAPLLVLAVLACALVAAGLLAADVEDAVNRWLVSEALEELLAIVDEARALVLLLAVVDVTLAVGS